MKSRIFLSIAIFSFVLFTASCGKEELFATVSIQETGSDLGGDVTGDGGSTQRSYTWNNSLNTVDYNMDITASLSGSFNLRIDDADGNNVLNQTLVAGKGEDTKSGVSSTGAAGDWTITVTLTNFNGDGSFSVSPGN